MDGVEGGGGGVQQLRRAQLGARALLSGTAWRRCKDSIEERREKGRKEEVVMMMMGERKGKERREREAMKGTAGPEGRRGGRLRREDGQGICERGYHYHLLFCSLPDPLPPDPTSTARTIT